MKILDKNFYFIFFKQADNYTRKDGYCMWYGQCGKNPSTNKHINCLYNGPAKPVDGPKSREILFELCPEFAHNDSKVCCSHSQLVSLQSGIQSAQQMMARCPGCWKNFRELYCRMTCSPNNSMFINATDLNANKTAIINIDYHVDKAFRDGLYNSCKNVVFPSSGQKIMSFMCGTEADKCTPLKFLNFMGNPIRNGESPFSINYPTTHKDSIDPMYVKIKLCNETVFRPVTNKTSKPCSCQDCIESCPPLPHYTPTKHWELDIGDIHFNLISFATLLVYLAFLVLFIAGSILYYRFSSKPSYQTHQYPQAVIGGRQRSLGVLARLGNSMDRTIKNIFTRWGNICCDYSIVVISGAVVFIIICSVGLLKFTVVTDPVKLWSSPGSQARREKDTFDNKFSPFYRTAQIIFSVKPGSKWNNPNCYRNFFTKLNSCILTGKILHLEALQKVMYVIVNKYKTFSVLIYSYINTSGNWENEKLCGNTTPEERSVFTQFRVFPISTSVDITVYQYGKNVLYLFYNIAQRNIKKEIFRRFCVDIELYQHGS